jgi:hypothetical protein
MITNRKQAIRKALDKTKAGPFLTLPSPFGHRSKAYFLTTYEFSIFVYSILKEKDMIGISIVTPNLFLQLQGLCLKTISIIL